MVFNLALWPHLSVSSDTDELRSLCEDALITEISKPKFLVSILKILDFQSDMEAYIYYDSWGTSIVLSAKVCIPDESVL